MATRNGIGSDATISYTPPAQGRFQLRAIATAPTRRGRRVRGAAAKDKRPVDSFQRALGAAGFREIKAYTLAETKPKKGARVTRSAAAGRDAGSVKISTATDEAAVMLMQVVDDQGQVVGVKWLFASGTPKATRSRKTRGARAIKAPTTTEWTFRVTAPKTAVAAATPSGRKTRGAKKILKRIVKALVFKLADRTAAVLLQKVVRKIEARNVAEGFKRVRKGMPKASGRAIKKWEFLDGDNPGRRLLVFIHGTASTSARGFGKLPAAFHQSIRERYGERIVAFDHWTLSKSPEENAAMFVDALPEDFDLPIDIVTHSRGGLVARAIKELPVGKKGRKIAAKVENVVLCAVPNDGTIIADGKRLPALVDLLSNLIDYLPAARAMIAIDIVLAIVQWAAARVPEALPGLEAQSPDSDLLRRLNDPVTGKKKNYSAVAIDYEPDGAFLARLADAGVDIVFKEDNDLVVPTKGVASVDVGDGETAILPTSVFERESPKTHHMNLFENESIRSFILDSLPA